MYQQYSIIKYACFFLLLIAQISLSQENCTNGIDDDGDGFIDLNDSECFCGETRALTIYGDFEGYSCCPNSVTFGGLVGGISCLADAWYAPSLGTTDFFHTCGFIGDGTIAPVIPMPIARGEGAIGLATINAGGYNEYIGICLNFGLIPGRSYGINFDVGFASALLSASGLDVEFAILGHDECDFNPVPTDQCLNYADGWYEMGKFSVSANQTNTWVAVTGNFTATGPAKRIAIGKSCDFVNNTSSAFVEYHFIDDIQLSGIFGRYDIIPEISFTGDCLSGMYVQTNITNASSYQWYLEGVAIPGATSNPYEVSPVDTGNYRVLVEFSNGTCGVSNQLWVAPDTDVLNINGTAFDAPCGPDDLGWVDYWVNSNSTPYEVTWATGSATGSLVELPPGTYDLTVTDNDGCSGTEQFTIGAVDALQVTATVNQPNNNNNSGSIELFPTGGTPNYRYFWSNGLDTPTIDNLTPDQYFVTVVDANGCNVMLDFEIVSPLSVTTEIVPESCFAACDASIALIIDSQIGSYSINWDIGSMDSLQQQLCPGWYHYSVTDANGFMIRDSVEITAASEMSLSLQLSNHLCLEGDTSNILANINQGNLPYHYLWSTGDTTPILSGITAGAYQITVTDSLGCIITDSIEIAVPPTIIVEENIGAIYCGNNDASGFINLNISNGNPPFSYLWSTGDTLKNITNLMAGNYQLTITDSLACLHFFDYEVLAYQNFTVQSTIQQLQCPEDENAAINLAIADGLPPYQITWSTGDTINNLQDLMAGSYAVSIVDNQNCTWADTFHIIAPNAALPNATIEHVACFGDSTGSILIEMMGDTTGLRYLWNTGETNKDLSNVPQGNYQLTINDGNNCTYNFEYSITENETFNVDTIVIPNNCYAESNASIEIIVPNDSFQIIWNNQQTDFKIVNLIADQYSATIANALGCTQSYEFDIPEVSELLVSETIIMPRCQEDSNGKISIDISGGTLPYQLLWSTTDTTQILSNLEAGNYQLTVTDGQNCEWFGIYELNNQSAFKVSTQVDSVSCYGENTGNITVEVNGNSPNYRYDWLPMGAGQSNSAQDLLAGVYYLTITDDFACEWMDSFLILEPPLFQLDSIIKENSCFGDSLAMIELIPPNSDFTISWNNGSTEFLLDSLPAGNYSASITNHNNCEQNYQFSIPEVSPIIINEHISLPNCFHEAGTIQIQTTGGAGNYQYLWNTSATDSFVNIVAGVYAITVTDEEGCGAQKNFSVTQPDSLYILLINSIEPTENGDDGSASIAIVGGTPSYELLWSNNQTTETANNLGFGSHSVTVTDMNGCVAILSFAFSPQPLIANTLITQNECFGDCLAQIEAIVSGGQRPYIFNWSNSQNGAIVNNLCNGNYSLSITDALGTVLNIDDLLITSPNELVTTATISELTCVEVANGAIAVNTFGGQPPYAYLWDDNTTDNTLSNLAVGTYEVAIMDNNNCTIEQTYEIVPFIPIDIDFEILPIDCEKNPAQLTLSTTPSNLSFSLNNTPIILNGGNTITLPNAGLYELQYEYPNGCQILVDSIDIAAPLDYQIIVDETERLLAANEIIEIEVLIEHGANNSPDFKIVWQSNNVLTCLDGAIEEACLSVRLVAEQSESLKIQIIDPQGCINYFQIPIQVISTDLLYVPNIFSPNDDGINDQLKIFPNERVKKVNTIKIFNRWGGLVHELSNIPPNAANIWDGRQNGAIADIGVYIYFIELELLNGEKEVFSGEVMLVR